VSSAQKSSALVSYEDYMHETVNQSFTIRCQSCYLVKTLRHLECYDCPVAAFDNSSNVVNMSSVVSAICEVKTS